MPYDDFEILISHWQALTERAELEEAARPPLSADENIWLAEYSAIFEDGDLSREGRAVR